MIAPHSTPSVPIKRYARQVLQSEVDPRFSKAIVDFVEAAYWVENSTNPNYHTGVALKRAQRYDLSNEEIVVANQRAQHIYGQYKQLAGISADTPLTPNVIAMITAQIKAEKRRNIEKEKRLKPRLERNFEELMALSDTQLSIVNANERVNFDADYVYANSGKETRKRIMRRSITESGYNRLQEKAIHSLQYRPQDSDERKAEKAVALLSAVESRDPKAINTVLNLLRTGDAFARQTAADALDAIGWKPQTATERAFYHIAKEEWDKLEYLGEQAFPALLYALKKQDIATREMAATTLHNLNWDPSTSSTRDQASYYTTTREWGEILPLGDDAIPALVQVLKDDDSVVRQRAATMLDQMDTPRAIMALTRLRKNKDEDIRQVAKDALTRRGEDPISLQKLSQFPQNVQISILHSTLVLNPEWEVSPPSHEDILEAYKTIALLPPVGGKTAIMQRNRTDVYNKILDPSLTIEEQIRVINNMRQTRKLGRAYIHQMTVQGRLPDEFKYVAIALILSSPYANDWSEPFFESPWGQVAPLVHDGGNVRLDINPLWKHVIGRTDFLQRVVPIYEPELEKLEHLTPEEKMKYSVEKLSQSRHEQEERDRLVLEAKAYQRLALSLHAFERTVPSVMPTDKRESLTTSWQTFQKRIDSLLYEYEIHGSADVTWFHRTPRKLKGWESYGLRHEADWQPIQEQLIHLEVVRSRYQELRERTKQILRVVTDQIDRTIGLLPKPIA